MCFIHQTVYEWVVKWVVSRFKLRVVPVVLSFGVWFGALRKACNTAGDWTITRWGLRLGWFSKYFHVLRCMVGYREIYLVQIISTLVAFACLSQQQKLVAFSRNYCQVFHEYVFSWGIKRAIWPGTFHDIIFQVWHRLIMHWISNLTKWWTVLDI